MTALALFASLSIANAQQAKKVELLDASSGGIYYDLEQGKSTKDKSGAWDIGFNKTDVMVNPGKDGKAKATALLVSGTSFDKLTKVPKGVFKTDAGDDTAIQKGSGNGWYQYNMEDHSITPMADRVIVVKTRSGKYVKIDIQNYYDNKTFQSGFYTFRYSEL